MTSLNRGWRCNNVGVGDSKKVKRMAHLLENSQNSSTIIDSSGSLTPTSLKHTYETFVLDEWTISIFNKLAELAILISQQCYLGQAPTAIPMWWDWQIFDDINGWILCTCFIIDLAWYQHMTYLHRQHNNLR